MTRPDALDGMPEEREAELQLLGALLLAPLKLPDVRGVLRVEQFASPAHRRIFAAMLAVHDAGEAVEFFTLRSHLQRAGDLEAAGGDAALSALLDVPTAANITAHTRLVVEAARRRRLAALGRELAEAVRTHAGTAEEILSAHLDALLREAHRRSDRGFRRVEGLPILEAIEQRQLGHVDGLPIGFRECDRRTAGFQRGELVIVGAIPKCGKSTLAAQMALQVALGGHGGAAIVSAEMPRRAVIERMLSALSGVPGHHLQAGQLSTLEWRRLVTAQQRVDAAPLWIADEALPTLEDVTQRVLALKTQHPALAFVVVDYLQLIQVRLKGRRGDEEIEAAANGLKRLADRAEVVIVSPAQLNLKSIAARPDPRPQLEDFSGGMGMLKACDFAALLYRPILHGGDPSHGDRLHVLFDAARRTGPFTFSLDWQATVTRAVEANPWTPPDAPLLLAEAHPEAA